MLDFFFQHVTTNKSPRALMSSIEYTKSQNLRFLNIFIRNTDQPKGSSRGVQFEQTFFFTPLLLWVFLICFTCNALLHIRRHSHSPPLIRHYVSYLISTFAEPTPGHMTPTRECTHLTNRVTSQCGLVTIFFSAMRSEQTHFLYSV